MLLFFSLISYPAEIGYFNSPNRELSNEVWLVEFRRRKVVVHIFLWVVPGHCLRAGFMESRNFCVLRLILVKFHIRTRLGLFPPLPISLADRNGLKNLPRQIFSACVKFGGNPCRDVETA